MHPCMQCSSAYSAGYLTFESPIATKDLSAVTMPCLPKRSCDVKILSTFLGVYICFLKNLFFKDLNMAEKKDRLISNACWSNHHSSFITHQLFFHIPFYLKTVGWNIYVTHFALESFHSVL